MNGGMKVGSSRSLSVSVVNSHQVRRSGWRSIRCSSGGGGGGDKKKGGGGGGGNKQQQQQLLVKSVWYASEFLGIAASFFLPSPTPPPPVVADKRVIIPEAAAAAGPIERALIVEAIKADFQTSYFVTGDLTLDAYEDNCEFADPAASFKGLRRFKRNCSNFGSLILKSNMSLIRWEDFEDKGVAHWRFSCTMLFPWKPILSATGYTEYYLSKESGKVCRHVEHWNVPKVALFRQLLKPSRQT